MAHIVGRELTISAIDSKKCTFRAVRSNWTWHEDMVEQLFTSWKDRYEK